MLWLFNDKLKKHTKDNFCYLFDVFNALIVYYRTILFVICETYTDI